MKILTMSLILYVIIPINCHSQISSKKISVKKTEKLLDKFNAEGNFDFENYMGIYNLRDSIKAEFIAFSIVYFRGDTLVLGIDDYKPKKQRRIIAERYFNSTYFSEYSYLMVIFGNSITVPNKEGQLIRESFTPAWTYVMKSL